MLRAFTSFAGLGVSALCLVLSLPVTAGNVVNGNKASVTLGGTVNRGFLYMDDGSNSRTAVVDNENDGSMFFIRGEAPVGEWTVGAYMATLFRDNASNEVSIDDASAGNGAVGDRGAGATSFSQRNMEISFANPRFGTFIIGQGETASDGAAEVDLSGTNVVGYSQVSDVAGGVKFRPASGGYGASIGETSDNLDGNDRDDRIRYDSPELAGFTLSTSYASGGGGDVALSYAGKFGAVEVNAALAYFNQSGISAAADTGVTGSVSVLHDSGVSLTLASGSKGQKAQGRDDQKFIYGKLGYAVGLNALGPTRFAVDYGEYADIAQNGDTMKTFGVQAVQDIDDVGASLYAGYRHYELDRPGTSFDDIAAVMAGARIAF